MLAELDVSVETLEVDPVDDEYVLAELDVSGEAVEPFEVETLLDVDDVDKVLADVVDVKELLEYVEKLLLLLFVIAPKRINFL